MRRQPSSLYRKSICPVSTSVLARSTRRSYRAYTIGSANTIWKSYSSSWEGIVEPPRWRWCCQIKYNTKQWDRYMALPQHKKLPQPQEGSTFWGSQGENEMHKWYSTTRYSCLWRWRSGMTHVLIRPQFDKRSQCMHGVLSLFESGYEKGAKHIAS